jgi:hypothetical protein
MEIARLMASDRLEAALSERVEQSMYWEGADDLWLEPSCRRCRR